ncbi:hypothetical protein ES288_A12G298600v1 [Gossypium darwinii]|uniref:Uncharacterized protein n=1 Tax=Gossypium darwinii TaxID=34276 RepID=A0A5D2EFE4_GOSDA|nr:hypothetical protein ES288_A12G298600v1 [Gossypium darwinii]
MGFQSKESSLQAENTDFNGEESESGPKSDMKEGLINKLKYISWPENVDWMHELPLDTDQEKKVDVNDDSARQLMFYTQALEGTRLAFEKFQSMGASFKRRRAGVGSKRPKRGKSKEAKRIAKEVQAEKLKERAKQKKQEIEAGLPDLGFEDSKSFERSSKKRPEFWNSKFGFRGRIGFKKQNTAETTNDLKGYIAGSRNVPGRNNREARFY